MADKESRIENDFEHYYNAVQKLKEDVAELNKKLNDREADLLNVRAETLKELEVGEPYKAVKLDLIADIINRLNVALKSGTIKE